MRACSTGLLVSGPLEPSSSVWPSGRAFATSSAPRVPPAPARFSTTTGWPSTSAIRAAASRAWRSEEVPAAKGTTMRTGGSGKPSAAAAPCARARPPWPGGGGVARAAASVSTPRRDAAITFPSPVRIAAASFPAAGGGARAPSARLLSRDPLQHVVLAGTVTRSGDSTRAGSALAAHLQRAREPAQAGEDRERRDPPRARVLLARHVLDGHGQPRGLRLHPDGVGVPGHAGIGPDLHPRALGPDPGQRQRRRHVH